MTAQYQRQWRQSNPGRAAEYQAKYRAKDPEKVRKQKLDSYYRRREVTLAKDKELRESVLEHYGHKCSCCGESRSEFLALDHADGGGHKAREEKIHPKSGKALYKWIQERGYPDMFRLLCHNCNLSLGFYGYCPHGGVPE